MNIGLVLSGGVAKGAYQAGFLKALAEDAGINRITAISGASIGLTAGYAYAAGKQELLTELWRSVHFDSLADLVYRSCFKHFLKDMVNELISENDYLSVPLYAPICYLPFLHMQYCRLSGKYHKRWYSFLRGAMNFPFLAGGPRFFRGQIAIDGGLADNIPVRPLIENERPDFILALHFEAGYRPRKALLDAKIPIIDYDITLHNMFRKRSFDFHGDTIRSMLESGYEYGKQICGLLFGGGKNDMNALLSAAERQRKEELPLRLNNVTFETWVQRMNQVLYPLTREKGRKIYDVAAAKKTHKSQQGEIVYADKKMP